MSEEESHFKSVTARLDRFETSVLSKLDLLTDALVKLAITEEKILSMERDRIAQHERLNKLSDKIEKTNDVLHENVNIVTNITRVFWLIIAALISSGIGILLTMV